MEIRRIESFMAVAELGSFSAASARLHRSQSAVSTHVQQLEEELGVRLFDRTTRRVTPTVEGRLLLGRCRTAMLELRSAAKELGEHSGLRRGHVSIGTVPSVSSHRLPAVLAAFKHRYPGVTIELHEGSVSRIQDDLHQRVTDFAIGPRFGASRDLAYQPIFIDPFVAVFPRNVATGPAVSLRELARHDQLSQSSDTAVRAEVELAFRKAGLEFRPTIEVSHHQTLINMVSAGLGVALLPSICIPDGARRAYKVVPLRAKKVRREICIVTLRGKILSAAAAQFAAMAAEMLQASAGLQDGPAAPGAASGTLR
jgi:LysR family transcriptional regulator, carnitine catabolism transcriptional activator